MSGSFLESCVFKGWREYVHYFTHSTDDLRIDHCDDIRQFYQMHIVAYFEEYVTEHLQSVENSALNEICDLIVYLRKD